jgi:DNA-directed RNA polymerase subunit F
MVNVVVRDLTPALENVAQDVGPILVDALELIAGVLKDATDESTPLGKSVKNLGDQFGILFDALNGGKSDIEGTTDTLSTLADIVSFLVTTMAGFVAFLQTLGPAINALLKGDVEKFWEWLTSDPIDFLNNQQAAEDALKQTRQEFLNTADSARKLNNIRLDKLRSQLGDLRIDGNKLAQQQRELYYAMRGEKPPTVGGGGDGGGDGGGGGGESAAEKRAKQRKEFNEIVKNTQRSLRDARVQYTRSVANANKQYREAVAGAEEAFAKAQANALERRSEAMRQADQENTKRIADIQRDFAKRLSDIVQQSQNRLRDVYRSAVATNIADLFTSEGVGKSVDKLVKELRDRLQASRKLVENASKLASEGFSQTFIEQVVSAGTTAGNELAQSILTATPETKAELRSLYGQLENQSETGMDALAATIYEKTGLATDALKQLYAETVAEQNKALEEQAQAYADAQKQILNDFDRAIADATNARNDALKQAARDLKDALTGANTEFRDVLDKIEEDFRDRLIALGKLPNELLNRQRTVQQQIDATQGGIQTVSNQIAATTSSQMTTNSVPVQTNAPNISITVNAGLGADGQQIGKTIVNEILRFERSSGQVFARAI